jgi:hypothetical protein
VGYEYENGTALLVDLNGRILQEFTLDGNRTLPIDLSNYPEGIYVVTIKTNLQTNSVKIIKGISKN